MTRLAIIIATYNRAELLGRLLASLRRAPIPPTMTVSIIVVDNNSRDETHQLVTRLQPEWNGRLEYHFEPQQGKCHALNRGLEASDADLIGLLDDDEEIDARWFETIARTFEDPDITFISGPYVPQWGGPIPAWLPETHPAIIGWVDAGPNVLEYEKNYFGVMMGGNAVVRSAALKEIGGFDPALGRTGNNLCGCEDADVYRRLVLRGSRGLYIPDLIIHHYVPPERLTKRYYRRWCLHHAVTFAHVNSERPQAVAHLLGIPRYLVGRAVRAVPRLAQAILRGTWNSPATFAAELALWDVAGFVLGKHFVDPTDLAKPTAVSQSSSRRRDHPFTVSPGEDVGDACRTN